MNDLLELPAATRILDRCDVLEIDPVARRDEWLEARMEGLGGSDIGPILGLSPYSSPMRVWAEKTRRIEPEDISAREPVRWGVVLESAIAEEFALRKGVKLHRPKAMFLDKTHPFLFCNPDGLYLDPDDGEPTVLEVKTAGTHLADHWAHGAIPPWYEAQGIHYAARLGFRRVCFAALIGGQQFEARTVNVTDEVAEAVTNASVAWWNRHIVADTPPAPDGSEDYRDLAGTLWTSEDKVIDIGERGLALAAAYREAHERSKQADKDKLTYSNGLRDLMREHREAVYDGTPIVTWRPANCFSPEALRDADPDLYAQYATKFDVKAFKADHPDLHAMFSAPSDGDRRLLVKTAATTLMEKIK